MNLSLFLFLIGVLGFILNRKNIILMIIAIEIMLLAVTLLVLISSFSFDDAIGQNFSIFIISIAGAESVIGLSILVAFYRFNSSIYTVLLLNKLLNYFLSYSPLINSSVSLKIRTVKTSIAQMSRKYSTYISKKNIIDPLFITGLFDAEGSFVATVLNNSRYKTGWNVQARIQIKMHERDRALIQATQDFFGGIGYVSKPNNTSTVEFRVTNTKDIVNAIIPHFDSYPLITQKYSDYILFKQIVLLMLNKEHLTYEGIQKIINIKASLNLGLNHVLKKAFPNTVPLNRYLNIFNGKIEPTWLAGFATGESNFFISLQKSKTKSGLAVSLRFSISQHSRDYLLLKNFITFFGCGYVVKYQKRSVCEFIVTKIDHIVEHIIPYFEKYPVVGSKHFNYLNFKNAACIIKSKEHLNPNRKGLEQILELKSNIDKSIK